jgi:hypothetical protein
MWVLGLLDKPILKGQAEVIQRYCCPNSEFYYLSFNTIGIRAMTTIHQIAQVMKYVAQPSWTSLRKSSCSRVNFTCHC